MKHNCLTFDIETVPDVEFGRRRYAIEDLSDEQVAQVMLTRRRQRTGNDFLAPHMHRVVAISVVLRGGDSLRVWSLGSEASNEAELVERFFEGVARYTPDLVSWNGSGFDLPVLHYRALRHGIAAPRYWESGDTDTAFRYNNYYSRYHWRHVDLMDVLSGFQLRAAAGLDDMACLLGLPGKLGMSGANVAGLVRAGELARVRDYCETDALNTYLIYLRFEHFRGHLDDAALAREHALVRETLKASSRPHLEAFEAAWPEGV